MPDPTAPHSPHTSDLPTPPRRAHTRPQIASATESTQHHPHHRHRHHGKRRWSLMNLRFNAAANAGKVRTKYDGKEGDGMVERTVVPESAPGSVGGTVAGEIVGEGSSKGKAAIGPLGQTLSPSRADEAVALDPLGDPLIQPADSVDLLAHPGSSYATGPRSRDFANALDHGEGTQTERPTGWQPGPYSEATHPQQPRRESKTQRTRASVSHFLINTLPSVLLEAPSDRKARRQSLQPGYEAAYPYVKPASGDAAAIEQQRRDSRRRSVEASKADPKRARRYSAVDLDAKGETAEVYDVTSGESVGIARRDGRGREGGDFAFM